MYHGLAAFSYDRGTEATLLSRGADLDRIPRDRFPDERLADEFHERHSEARADLQLRAQSVR